MLVDHVGSCCGNTSDRVGVNFMQDQLVERIINFNKNKENNVFKDGIGV